ncbi:unnamed protein product [Paramecium primaurelia]|uniref:Tetratricopeptide repeat protein n=1 Tax=Paramecium primaurelia TaxID=5886 RepID=A0A8S1LW09_PARPR|nr:unnamed protein product [Paramecium primaurelia]
MIVRQSISPKRKSVTPSMYEGRQYQNTLRCSNLKTESLDQRNVCSRNDDYKRKQHNISNPRKIISIQNHKASLNSSYNSKNLKTIQTSTRKLSLQTKTMISSTTSDNCQIQKFFLNPIANILQTCERLIKAQRLEEAMKELEEIDSPHINQDYQQQIAFFKGTIHMQNHQYEKAINSFQKCRQLGDLNGNAQVLQAISLRKIGNYIEAISILKDFLLKNNANQSPVYYDAVLQKGKLLMKLKKYKLAMHDFMIASTLEKDMQLFQGTLGKGDCLRYCGKIFEALIIYEGIPDNQQVLIRKIICYLELQQFDKALDIINKILIKDSNNSQALYLKGQVFMKKGKFNEAILSFEQSITENNSRKAVMKSLIEIAKIKIDQKDFYSAYYTLQRQDHLDVDKASLMDLKQFTEGVIFLMKRKYKDAIIVLTELINKQQLGEFIKKLIFLYRAYGFICVNKYQNALKDFNYIQRFNPLETTQQYNMIICEGIVMSQQNQFEKSQQLFQKASQIFPGKMEPHFYKALTLIQFVNKLQMNGKDKYIKKALKYLDKAVTLNDNNSKLLYHRGIIRFYFGQLELALQDLTIAIENNEERNSKILYARGLVQACLDNPQQALIDFTVAINWDPKYAELYLNRAKVNTQLGNRTEAFEDLQIYISTNPTDPQIYLWAGNLSFHLGSHLNAIKTYSHSPELQNNVQLLSYRAMCFIIEKDLNNAFVDLNRIYEITSDKRWLIDKECLNALKIAIEQNIKESILISNQANYKSKNKSINFRQASKKLKQILNFEVEGYLFMKSDLLFYRGVMKFYQGNYIKAIDNWNESYELMKQQKREEMTSNVQSDSSEGSQRMIIKLNDLEFQDRPYNMYEYQYNVAIATILNNLKPEGKLLLEDLSKLLPQTFTQGIMQFRDAIDSQQIQRTTLFQENNRLCELFPKFKVGNAVTRLSFCLPKLPSPCMKPEFDQQLLQCIQSIDVENKPEAPWIKRNLDGVIFTENVQQVELDLQSETQRSQLDQSQEHIVDEVEPNVYTLEKSTSISN